MVKIGLLLSRWLNCIIPNHYKICKHLLFSMYLILLSNLTNLRYYHEIFNCKIIMSIYSINLNVKYIQIDVQKKKKNNP